MVIDRPASSPADPTSARLSSVALVHQNGKRRESEQRRQDVNEEHGRERKHERRHSDRDPTQRAEAGLKSLDDPRDEQHEQHRGQRGRDEPERPHHAERAVLAAGGAGNGWPLARKADRSESLVGREPKKCRAGSAHRVVVPAEIREIARLPPVPVYDRRARGQRANERVNRALIPRQPAGRVELQHHERIGECERACCEHGPRHRAVGTVESPTCSVRETMVRVVNTNACDRTRCRRRVVRTAWRRAVAGRRLQCMTVYGFDWADKALWTTEPEPGKYITSQLDRAAVERTLLIHWQEHCIECAPPECFAVCPLYVARVDRKCARFVYGIFPNPAYSGLLDVGADVRFRRWAKLEARVSGPSVTPAVHRRLARVDGRITGVVGGVSRASARLSPRRRLNGAHAVLRDRLLPRTPGSKTLDFDVFVLECHAPDEEAFRLVLEWAPRDRTTFRHVFEIEPGPNLHVLPAEAFGPLGDGAGGRISLYPEDDAERRVVFTWLDFVRYLERPKGTADAGRPSNFVKCLAWDLDNTLWAGTLLEDGPGACRLRPEAAELVHRLDERGILQTIVSKNDHHEAWALVEQFGLAEYFLYPAIGWGRKSDSLRRLSKRLNIGLDTLGLVDDSAFERAEIAQTLPMVRVYEETALRQLLTLPEFEVPVTEFSGQRRAQYRTQIEREQAGETFSGDYLEFLRSCELELEVFEPLQPDQIERCLELVQRSNQLNLSKRAYTSGEFEALLGTDGILALALEAQDRFGRYGIIGFVAVDERNEIPAVRDFVLSCRVAQKRVEHAFFGWLAARETGRGAARLRADLVKTNRNGPLQQVFDELPFKRVMSDSERISYELTLPAEGPEEVVAVRSLLAA